ncbi:unnamed protein product [Penicillium nalgiovense]|nr:unnamed protein product [Penicillium nalgiovense]
MGITQSNILLGNLGHRLGFVMKSRVACCPTVSLDWEDFLCVISSAAAVSIFFLCLCAWAKWSGTNPMMMCLLWRYDCTILMTCNDKSDVLYFLMSSFCQRFVYSLSCWAYVFLLVTLFATPSGGERLYPYLFTCHVSTGHLFLWPYL